MKQTPLKIHLLGPVEVKHQDKLLKISRRKERIILYVLAIKHKPVSRTKLIDLLWRDAKQSDPRASLRTALSRLRSELPDPDLILTDLDQIKLNLDRCDIDVEIFENQYRNLQNLLSTYQNQNTLPTAIVEQIEHALGLWRGTTLISGDNLSNYPVIDNWRQSINRKYNHQRKFLISRLAEHYQKSGKPEKALTLFMLLGRIDTSDVSSQCAALDLLIMMGRHQDAVNYCDTLEDVYEREYNAPLPEEILFRCQKSSYRISASQEDEKYQWPIPLTMQLQMIGRESEIIQLHQAFYKGGIVVVQGEMGSGKTRLVQELFQSLSPKPLLMLAPSKEMETNLPFSPIIHCLRHSLPDHIWKEIDPVWVNQLSLLLPELANLSPAGDRISLSTSPSGEQNLYEGLRHICQHITKKYGRILFFLDDAHWADVQTLQALSYLMSDDIITNHGLLVMASRPEETNRDLDFMIHQFFRSHSVQIIKLHGLNEDELQNLAKQILSTPPSKAFISQLFRETNGNPFIAIEIIRDILGTGDGFESYCETSNLPLPTNVHILIRKRLLQLDETSRHILLCAAVLGNDLSVDLLQSVADISSSSISKILDPLLQSGFIKSTIKNNPGKSRLHFVHEKMREVILKEASDVKLKILHHQTGQHMAIDPQYSDKASVIASHFLLSDDEKNAFKWFLKAADHAWILGSKENAQNAYIQAEKLLENNPETLFTPERTLKLYQQWSVFAYQSNQVELVEKLGAKLQHIGGSVNHPLLIGTSQIILSNACFLRQNFDTGFDLINKAIEYIDIAGDRETLIKAIKRKGVISWWTMNYDQVEVSANRVLELCQETRLPEDLRISMEFNAQHLINMMEYTHGNASSASQTANTLYTKYFHKLEPFDQLRSLYLLGYSNLISAEYGKCEYYTKKALKISRSLGLRIIEQINLVILSKAELYQGKLNQSYQHGLEALNSAEKGNRLPIIIAANCVLGDILYAVGNITAAAQHYRVGQIREGVSNLSFYGIENNLHLAHLLAWSGQIPEAKEILQRNEDHIETFTLNQYLVVGLLVDGICDFHESKLSFAEDKFNKAIEIAETKGLLFELGLNNLALARLMMAKNEIDKAQKLINKNLKISQSKNMPLQSIYGLELSMRIFETKNQPEMLQKHQTAYENLLKDIEDNLQSEPLKQDFIDRRKFWDQEHHFPS